MKFKERQTVQAILAEITNWPTLSLVIRHIWQFIRHTFSPIKNHKENENPKTIVCIHDDLMGNTHLCARSVQIHTYTRINLTGNAHVQTDSLNLRNLSLVELYSCTVQSGHMTSELDKTSWIRLT